MGYNAVKEKSKVFATRIVTLYKILTSERKEYVMSKQVLRSGTSIGANIYEAIYAESTLDFIHKKSIALKETSETQYWLEILHDTGFLSDIEYTSIINDCVELLKLLISIINTKKAEYNKELSEKKTSKTIN